MFEFRCLHCEYTELHAPLLASLARCVPAFRGLDSNREFYDHEILPCVCLLSPVRESFVPRKTSAIRYKSSVMYLYAFPVL